MIPPVIRVPEKAVTVKEAAEKLGLSVWYLRSMRRAGCPWAGRRVFMSALVRWLAEHPRFVARKVWGKGDGEAAG